MKISYNKTNLPLFNHTNVSRTLKIVVFIMFLIAMKSAVMIDKFLVPLVSVTPAHLILIQTLKTHTMKITQIVEANQILEATQMSQN